MINLKAKIYNYGPLHQNRCTFTPFDKNNDINSKSKKVGIRCHNRLTAFILSIFGKIVTIKDASNKKIYLNKGSLKKWLSVHGVDLKVKSTFKTKILNVCSSKDTEISEEKSNAATKIQGFVRKFLERRREEKSNAATKIQGFVRKFLEKRRKEKAAVKIQACMRMLKLKKEKEEKNRLEQAKIVGEQIAMLAATKKLNFFKKPANFDECVSTYEIELEKTFSNKDLISNWKEVTKRQECKTFFQNRYNCICSIKSL